jgi:hypothetical protein
MNTQRRYEGQELNSEQLKLSQSAVKALRLLDTCPLLPVDAFRGLTGLSSIGGAYKQLAKLRSAGLVDAHRVEAELGGAASMPPGGTHHRRSAVDPRDGTESRRSGRSLGRRYTTRSQAA